MSGDKLESYTRILEAHPELQDMLRLRWSSYIPHAPTPKQRLFLLLPQREAFYGGAAGGGKSDALLMGALQYMDIPGYSAVIFRKTLTDLRLPGALIDRSQEWLLGTDVVYGRDAWNFPSGATLQFGYLRDELAKYRYQGAEFQYIAFDEVTQFYEEDYLYLRSRLRRPRCPLHGGRVVDGVPVPLPDDLSCPSCREYGPLSRVPLRMRAAANPGGIGHLWVKKRFDIGPQLEGHDAHGRPIHRQVNGKTAYIGRNPKRPYVPALITDNPYLDQKEYIDSLRELDPVTREQLLCGDWSIASDGRFRRAWVRYYTYNSPYLILGADGKGRTIPLNTCQRFQIVDPAASAREGPGDREVYRGAPSWTVIGTFLRTPCNNLIWWDLRRFRKEIPEIFLVLKSQYREHAPSFIGIEASGLGIGLYQLCSRAGLPVKPLRPNSQDKLVRATDACNRMERGMIWLPQTAPWLEDLEAELFTWTGHPHQQDDQIDVLAYAAMEVSREAAYTRSEEFIAPSGVGYEEFVPEVF